MGIYIQKQKSNNNGKKITTGKIQQEDIITGKK